MIAVIVVDGHLLTYHRSKVRVAAMTRPAVSAARRRRVLGENLLAYAFLLPAFAVLLVFHFLPAFAAIYMSLFRWDIVQGPFRGLDNYATVLVGTRAEEFWQRVKQGVAILTEPRRFLREVVSWQALGWLCRFGAFWYFLEAFGIGGSFQNVMLVMSVQAISTMLPFTPGGAGAQQGLLLATLQGPSRAAVLSFSVGTQIAMAAWSALLGFAALLLIFRTTNWRALIHAAESEAKSEELKQAAAEKAGAQA